MTPQSEPLERIRDIAAGMTPGELRGFLAHEDGWPCGAIDAQGPPVTPVARWVHEKDRDALIAGAALLRFVADPTSEEKLARLLAGHIFWQLHIKEARAVLRALAAVGVEHEALGKVT